MKDMNEKINEIKETLMDWMEVSLAKQCKNEYIVYTFNTDTKREKIIRQTKEHFSDKQLNNSGKYKKTKTNVTIDYFLNHTVCDLLNRGYELETFEW